MFSYFPSPLPPLVQMAFHFADRISVVYIGVIVFFLFVFYVCPCMLAVLCGGIFLFHAAFICSCFFSFYFTSNKCFVRVFYRLLYEGRVDFKILALAALEVC